MIKNFNTYNESLRDKMLPKTKKDIDISDLVNKKYTKTKPVSASNLKNGVVHTTFNHLVELFGQPESENWTSRMNYCWYLVDEKDNYIEIYDWNTSDFITPSVLKTGVHMWDVKSKSEKALKDVIKYIQYNTLNENIRNKMTPKSDKEILKSVKALLGVDYDYIKIQILEPHSPINNMVLDKALNKNKLRKKHIGIYLHISGKISDMYQFVEDYFNINDKMEAKDFILKKLIK